MQQSSTEPYSIQLLANDTAGLMDALKIQKANVLGYSLGAFTTQQFAISHPDNVSSVIVVAGTCGGKDGIPKPTEFKKLQSDITNKSQNNVPRFSGGFESAYNCLIGIGMDKTAS